MNEDMQVSITTNVLIKDETHNEVLLDKSNAIHPQNMSRILARALSNEPNAIISRMAFGNGGTFKDVGDNLIFNPPNDGRIAGWESRLYNETYSEIVDESDPNLGEDLGSSGPNVIRPGGGSDPISDPTGTGVVSQEAGIKSNVVITMFLNENEPAGQDTSILYPSGNDIFTFDEIGLYSPGAPAISSPGYGSINVGNKTSEDVSPVVPSSELILSMVVDGTSYTETLTVPSSGSGPIGEITYGDICEGFNLGTWHKSDDTINLYAYMYITDISGGTYGTITGRQSYGLLTFQSKSTGLGSSIVINCDANIPEDFGNVLTNGVCENCSVSTLDGADSGIANDPIVSDNERERLLTHIIFTPIPKAEDVAISITYTLTVSVCNTSDSDINILGAY
jgi:hypothetical protein